MSDINATLSNHMTEYRAEFRVVGDRLRVVFWALGLIAAVVIMAIGSLLAVMVAEILK